MKITICRVSVTVLTIFCSCGKAPPTSDHPTAQSNDPNPNAAQTLECTSQKVTLAVQGCLVAKSDDFRQKIEFTLDQAGKGGSFTASEFETQYFQERYRLTSAEISCVESYLCQGDDDDVGPLGMKSLSRIQE